MIRALYANLKRPPRTAMEWITDAVRAAAILGLPDSGLVAVEDAPALVKQTVAGYGRGEKSQVAEMVRLQLGLATLPTPADAADALAIAMTHWAHARLNALGARL